MSTQDTPVRSLQLPGCRGPVVLVLALVLSGCASVGLRKVPVDTATPPMRQRFLEMWARAYFPGRTGQLLIVPREGEFITRPDPNYTYMHGSPWPYDVSVPLMFVGPAVKSGVYSGPASQQDVAPTLAAALGLRMPLTATGRVLPVFQDHFANPRAVITTVIRSPLLRTGHRRSVASEVRSAGEKAHHVLRAGELPDVCRRGPPGGTWPDLARSRSVPGVTAVYLCRIHKRRCIPCKGLATEGHRVATATHAAGRETKETK